LRSGFTVSWDGCGTIDPGVVQDITVIDGPYTSLYGPGFAFMAADLLSAPRFDVPQTRLSTNFVYGSNAQALYNRDNVLTGGKDWGACISYGLRDGNDYRTGGPDGYTTFAGRGEILRTLSETHGWRRDVADGWSADDRTSRISRVRRNSRPSASIPSPW
jgi:hypothetical protein